MGWNTVDFETGYPEIEIRRNKSVKFFRRHRGKGEADRLPKWQKERLLIVLFFLLVTAAIYQNGEEKQAMRWSFEIATDGGIKKIVSTQTFDRSLNSILY